MTDFTKILDKAKELETKMKESQEKIKKIQVEGISGSNSVKVILDGEGEMQKIEISDEILKEDKAIVEDLIVAAHNNAKAQLKAKTIPQPRKVIEVMGRGDFKTTYGRGFIASLACGNHCRESNTINHEIFRLLGNTKATLEILGINAKCKKSIFIDIVLDSRIKVPRHQRL